MSKYFIANLTIEMIPLFDKLRIQSKNYLTDEHKNADFSIVTDDCEIRSFHKTYPHLSLEDCEYILVGSKFYQNLLHYNGMLIHSSAVVKDNEAFLFSAPSGTGKSTHTSFWLKTFSDSYILNDDKPALRIIDGKVKACGTPFSGKTNLQKNAVVNLNSIVFIERSDTPWIKRVDSQTSIYQLMNQTVRIPRKEEMSFLLSMIDTIVRTIPIYKMGVTLDDNIAEFSYKAIKNSQQ